MVPNIAQAYAACLVPLRCDRCLRKAAWQACISRIRHCQLEGPCCDCNSHFESFGVSCSGSGKSTLLDILAQRKTVGNLKGQVLIAGYPPTQTFLRRYAGYVEQFDTLIPVLTVHEMLLYTAELKTSRSVSLQVCMLGYL